jgi:hypothetical protein
MKKKIIPSPMRGGEKLRTFRISLLIQEEIEYAKYKCF